MAIYVRNWRPNQLIFRHADLKIRLGRRGERTDNVALPDEALSNPDVAKFLRNGRLERISEEAYFNLATRPEDEEFPEIKRADTARVKIRTIDPNPEAIVAKTPGFVEDFDKRKVRSPGLEWAQEPEASQPPFEGETGAGPSTVNTDPFGVTKQKTARKPAAKKAS